MRGPGPPEAPFRSPRGFSRVGSISSAAAPRALDKGWQHHISLHNYPRSRSIHHGAAAGPERRNPFLNALVTAVPCFNLSRNRYLQEERFQREDGFAKVLSLARFSLSLSLSRKEKVNRTTEGNESSPLDRVLRRNSSEFRRDASGWRPKKQGCSMLQPRSIVILCVYAARRTRTVAPMARLATPFGSKVVADTPFIRPVSVQNATAGCAHSAMEAASS